MAYRHTTPLLCLIFLLLAHTAHAHEVYVLNQNQMEHALAEPRVDFISVIQNNLGQFIVSGIIAIALVAGAFLLSQNRSLQQFFTKPLIALKPFAPIIMQATLGLALVASGLAEASFGTELPLSDSFGTYAPFIKIVFMILGACMLIGIYPRIVGAITLVVFLPLLTNYHVYMVNYATYFGEALALTLFGGGYALWKAKTPSFEKNIEEHFHKYKFLLLRIFFGASLLYASFYAKFLYSGLAMDTVSVYHLTNYFPFEASFIVLGAFITEILIGTFFLIGFEVRLASIVFLLFLVQSLFFFGEAVWPHIILIGTSLAMLTHGYDQYTLGYKLARMKTTEPVL